MASVDGDSQAVKLKRKSYTREFKLKVVTFYWENNLYQTSKLNAPFKAAVERQATIHLQENLDSYVQGKINASERRVLFTKWVGTAWEEVSSNMEMIIRSFRKCGIALAIDGSEDSAININGLENYSVESDDESSEERGDEVTGEDTDDVISDEEDPFADLD